MLSNHNELSLIAQKEFSKYEDMYKVVDFLNKNLKGKGLIFGLTRKEDMNIISIYRTDKNQKDTRNE